MDLENELAAQIERFNSAAPADKVALFERMREELRERFHLENALATGDQAPDLSLPEARGNVFALSEALSKGPVVLAFYRGGWCPYCNIQLRAYQERLPQIRALGARLVAVSPQTPDASLSTAEKDGLEFHVLSDMGNVVARAFGLVYVLAPELQEAMKSGGKPLSAFNGDESWELPVPGTYVVAPDGRITLSYVQTDHRQRLAPEKIISALETLRESRANVA